jgi:hypothetical protein
MKMWKHSTFASGSRKGREEYTNKVRHGGNVAIELGLLRYAEIGEI